MKRDVARLRKLFPVKGEACVQSVYKHVLIGKICLSVMMVIVFVNVNRAAFLTISQRFIPCTGHANNK